MKILVTVGTTPFDTLIQFLDTTQFNFDYEFIFQIANGNYIPTNHISFQFNPNIWEDYKDYFVITHCGAGSLYFLLENNYKFICVPNLERIDQHQLDIANFIKKEKLASVATNFSDFEQMLNGSILSKKFNPYIKDFFFKEKEINSIIKE